MYALLARYKEEDKPKLISKVSIKVHDFIDAGIVYSKSKDKDQAVLIHPYGRAYNKWQYAYQREFTEVQKVTQCEHDL